MYLIGITGRKSAGKDTAFLAIRDWAQQRGILAERRGFADKLKLSAYRIFNPEGSLESALEWCDQIKKVGTEVCWIDDNNDESEGVSGRQFLQHYGTEAHRQIFGDNFWVDHLLPTGYETAVRPKWWSSFDVDTVIAVITDVRFPNEAERVKELGGVIFEIQRNSGAPADTHSSEKPLDPELVDQTIYNSQSRELFKSTVKVVMDDHYGMVELTPNQVTTNIEIEPPKEASS